METIIIAIITSGALSAIISGIFGLISRFKDKENSINMGVRILLYDRIKYLGKSYINNAAVSAEDLEDLIKMHSIYHDMGGNGFLDRLMAQVKQLPIR